MTLQLDPQLFNPNLPIYTVTYIDQTYGLVSLNGSDGTSLQVPVSAWGPLEEAQPLIGSKVQLLH